MSLNEYMAKQRKVIARVARSRGITDAEALALVAPVFAKKYRSRLNL
jgi:hypothetical protein